MSTRVHELAKELGLSEGGLPLGCDPQKAYDQLEVNLLPGDEVILYTDGISEAMNANGDVYGASTVRNMVARAPVGVDVHRDGVGLRRAGRAAALGYVPLEEAREAPDDLRVGSGHQPCRVDDVDEQHRCELALHV